MHLLLIEDERKVASFIARSLRENTHTVDIASTGQKGLDLAARISYDAILLDIRLPGISGIQVCRELRQSGVEIPVLMLTARTLVEQRVEGLDAGADDYLTKPFALEELQARVRAITRREGKRKLQCADLEFDKHKGTVSRGGEQISLTTKELALLELLLVRSPEPVGRTAIVEYVWSYGFDTETNMVEVYVNRLRQKIDQPHRIKLIHTVRGVGYRLGLLP
jgi:DNA-binding response OmpR family regulator